jgi:hypothetical protein
MGQRRVTDLVHATPGALGSVTPEMAWMRDDFPELWEPMTTMMGRSMSRSSLFVCQPDVLVVLVGIAVRDERTRCLPDVVQGVHQTQLLARILGVATAHDGVGFDISRGGIQI